MLSIGEFSQATRLTVKTLRFYHELGILVPVRIDDMTGYRYYDERSFERAEAVIMLKDLGFSLPEIGKILSQCTDEEDLQCFIRGKLREIRDKVESLKQLESRLLQYEERLKNTPPEDIGTVEETILSFPHLACVSFRGRYEDIGSYFRLLYKKTGRYATGQPYGFFYDLEYREEDASLEAVMELRQEVRIDGIAYRTMENLKAVKTLYRGPYGSQGSSYMRLFAYCREKGYSPIPPVIEHYIKGPGVIFRGNPQRYLTECMLVVQIT